MTAMLFALLLPFAANGDARYPFRTDSANEHRPWYRLVPGTFPPEHSEHRVDGELVEVDYLHRAGVFRMDGTGELMSFTMPPFGTARYLGAEADLRDLPMGTHLKFSLYTDECGAFTRLVRVQDDRPRPAEAKDFERRRKSHAAFLKDRGLPAWIDRVDGRKLTVTLIGTDRETVNALFKDEGIDPERWAREHRSISVVVANEHLRTYWPPVNNVKATVRESLPAPMGVHGCAGVRWAIEPNVILEGFRKGRIVRLFVHPSWPITSMPFGEGLNEGGHHDEEPADAKELEPADYPYRTDFGNAHLPWYRLEPGKFPPEHSEHRVGGDLVSVDAGHRSGRFRTDRTGELVDFTMPPFAFALFLNAEAEIQDLPLGVRYLFFLYKDEKGTFTKAAMIVDEYTDFAGKTLTYRFESANLKAGKLYVARHAAPVQVDYVLEPQVPPDFGRLELEVDDRTRVWKAEHAVKLTDIVVGDELLVNLAARTRTSRGRCTDIWIGSETHRFATDRRRKSHGDSLREHGVPGWIDRVDGNDLTVTFFAGIRKDFRSILGADPWGKSVHAIPADEARLPRGAVIDRMGFKNCLPEADTTGTHGCSGVRWVLTADRLSKGYRPGGVIRVFNAHWPINASRSNEDRRP